MPRMVGIMDEGGLYIIVVYIYYLTVQRFVYILIGCVVVLGSNHDTTEKARTRSRISFVADICSTATVSVPSTSDVSEQDARLHWQSVALERQV
jgi:hypothetical protein